MAERLALYPGSFDPITHGHVDILRRATRLFDRIAVLVAAEGKARFWPAERRAQLWREIIRAEDALASCEVEVYAGLLVDAVAGHQAVAVIRGLRSARDFEQEWSLHGVNRKLRPDFETVWLPAREDLAVISSSLVREAARFGGDLTALVPEPVAAALAAWPPR